MIIASKNEFLEKIVELTLSSKKYVGVCVYEGGAFGEGWQHQLIQLQDGSFLYESIDSINRLVERRKVSLDVNFPTELSALRTEQFKLRSMLNKNPDLESD